MNNETSEDCRVTNKDIRLYEHLKMVNTFPRLVSSYLLSYWPMLYNAVGTATGYDSGRPSCPHAQQRGVFYSQYQETEQQFFVQITFSVTLHFSFLLFWFLLSHIYTVFNETLFVVVLIIKA
jgi:hypothetical protein